MAKHYTVWVGHKIGVCSTWEECQKRTKGFSGARFKSFPTKAEADQAFIDGPDGAVAAPGTLTNTKGYIEDSISVDVGTQGNPGIMEFKGVNTSNGALLFEGGPYTLGTNNMGEFLGIVTGLQYLQEQQKFTTPVYTDSVTALTWIRNKKVASTLVRNDQTSKLWEDIEEAIQWLKENDYQNPLLKWDTVAWGEIKADYGRK